VTGKTLLHLQCHIGTDTLSWARAGARVTGLDFSAPAIDVARGLAERIGAADARFVVSDVYDAAAALGHAVYDVVYTGIGALCWLPDIGRWARTVADLIAPGGCLYLVEFHPVTDMFDEDGTTVRLDYFDGEAQVWDGEYTYTDGEKLVNATVTHQYAHPLGEIVSSLISAGLRLEFLHEYDFSMFQRFTELEERAGRFHFPPGQARIPLRQLPDLRRAAPGVPARVRLLDVPALHRTRGARRPLPLSAGPGADPAALLAAGVQAGGLNMRIIS
jgi:SAM-dependent methyltransferase